MQRDPALPRRRSIRLPLFDYAQPYFYFVTICSFGKECIFGHVEGREMFLNALGRLVDECWRQIPRHFSVVELAPHVVMPNHIHGIIRLRHATDGASVAKQLGRARHAVPLRPDRPVREFASPTVGSIPTIVGAFKAAVSKRIRALGNSEGRPIWQRGYFERVIRTEKEFGAICEYIRFNPSQWNSDEENADRKPPR